MEKIVIIGSGPAGLTAAIYNARASMSPVVIEGDTPGGQLLWTTEVENFPGFKDGIMGPKLMMEMKAQAERFGTRFVRDKVKSVDFSKRPYKIFTETEEFETEAVIVATGARSRMLKIADEEKFLGKGVHTCATCDGAFYREKEVMIVGGGDSAMEEANFLTKFASKVYVVHRKAELNASEIMKNRTLNNSKIEIIWNSVIKEYLGDGKLTAVRLLNNSTNEITEKNIDAVFLAIGHIPNTEFLQGQLKLGKENYIEPINWVFTEKIGIFVAGDVADWRYRQAITAAGFGCMASLEAEKYVDSLEQMKK